MYWYTEYPFAQELREYFIYPGNNAYSDYMFHSLRSACGGFGIPKMNCRSKNSYLGRTYYLADVAICFDVKTMLNVDCGHLFGAGTCPSFGFIELPHVVPAEKDTKPTFNKFIVESPEPKPHQDDLGKKIYCF